MDNDTAAADGLRGLNQAELPTNIRVKRYSDLDLAREYPTLGPPTVEDAAGSVAVADVNGLAASIELYLGRDVLTTEDGHFRPVQWKAYTAGMSRYQGEVMDKAAIRDAFRAKSTLAVTRPESVKEQDWADLRLIIDAALSAFS